MGCDVHAHFEVLIDGEWLHYSQPVIERNYSLFMKMAGVRGSITQAICRPRGLPADMDKLTAFDAHLWGDTAHSHSWLNEDEVSQVIRYHAQKLFPSRDVYEEWGYLFGNPWDGFREYRQDYPEQLSGFRLVFWFDN